MKFPRPRFTLRWLMVAVAVAALLLAARIWIDTRRAHFNQLVRQYYDERYRTAVFSYSGPGGAIMEHRMQADAHTRAKRSARASSV